MTLWESDDFGKSWKFVKTIFAGNSAYSSLGILKGGKQLSILFEWSREKKLVFKPDFIVFQNITLG